MDRAYLLASPTMSAETTYVGMTRHRAAVTMFYGQDGFARKGGLVAGLSRPERKEFSPDYERDRAADAARAQGVMSPASGASAQSSLDRLSAPVP